MWSFTIANIYILMALIFFFTYPYICAFNKSNVFQYLLFSVSIHLSMYLLKPNYIFQLDIQIHTNVIDVAQSTFDENEMYERH